MESGKLECSNVHSWFLFEVAFSLFWLFDAGSKFGTGALMSAL